MGCLLFPLIFSLVLEFLVLSIRLFQDIKSIVAFGIEYKLFLYDADMAILNNYAMT